MNYSDLLQTYTAKQWKKIGIKRRAGVAVPLFSLYSKRSTGIGELPDLKKLIDWCKLTGMSIIQLLPLNEVGSDFAPYNAISTFALDPMYLRLEKLRLIKEKKFDSSIKKLKRKFPIEGTKVDYGIKNEKLKLLYKIYRDSYLSKSVKFKRFIENNAHWLRDYALFKLIKDSKDKRGWFDWEEQYRERDEKALQKLENMNRNRIEFYCWLQWQLYEQLSQVKKYAQENGVYLMGDIPFLVARDSADVWANQNYFKIDYEAGAPPDMYFSQGQRWGMPPYDWNNIARDGFKYIKERLKYADRFYDMFRIDHFIGLLRVWIIPSGTLKNKGAEEGKFDPEQEYIWGEHGRKLLSVMIEDIDMLPCAEDLGTVPKASYSILNKFGIPGMEVQRWNKIWDDNGFSFLKPENYRVNSVATVSTHDSSFLPVWWKYEAGSIEEKFFEDFCKQKKISKTEAGKLRKELFDEEHPGEGRLYWKDEVNSVEKLVDIIGLSQEECEDIINAYRTSYGEKEKFRKLVGFQKKSKGDPDVEFITNSLEAVNRSASIFSIQLLFEWLYPDEEILETYASLNYRINSPGIVNDENWRIVAPVSLDGIKKLPVNKIIKKINSQSERI